MGRQEVYVEVMDKEVEKPVKAAEESEKKLEETE